MEVSKIGENGVKLKGKAVSFGINPFDGKAKNIVDAVLLLQKGKVPELQVEENPIVFNGPGEYEIKGIKLTGIGKGDSLAYTGKIDNIEVFITKTSSIAKAKDILQECQVAIIETDEVIEDSFLAKLNANVVVVYGANAQAVAKALGKEATTSNKYAITRDKLPSEMEVVILQ